MYQNSLLNSQNQALFTAISRTDIEAMQGAIANGANLNAKNGFGKTALHQAVSLGSVDAVRLLAGAGAGLNERDAQGRTPLYEATTHHHLLRYRHPPKRRGDMYDCLSTLLQRGANPTIEDNEGISPACKAAELGDTKTLDILLRYNAGIDALDERGYAPLHAAAENGQPEVVRYLFQKSASINLPTRDGFTALHLTALNAENDLSSGAYPATTQALCDAGADVDAADLDGNRPLHAAVQTPTGHDGCIPVLLAGRANPNAQNGAGDTPLHTAAQSGFLSAVSRLVEQPQTDLDIVNGQGQSAYQLVLQHEDRRGLAGIFTQALMNRGNAPAGQQI